MLEQVHKLFLHGACSQFDFDLDLRVEDVSRRESRVVAHAQRFLETHVHPSCRGETGVENDDFGSEAEHSAILAGKTVAGAVGVEMGADYDFFEFRHFGEEGDVAGRHQSDVTLERVGHCHVDMADVGGLDVTDGRDEFGAEGFGLFVKECEC